MQTQEINPDLLDDKNIQIIDVRTYDEWKDGHIKGSILVPLKMFGFANNVLQSEVDPNKPVGIICRTGFRSKKAAQILEKNGFKHVINLDGGIKLLVEKYNFELTKE